MIRASVSKLWGSESELLAIGFRTTFKADGEIESKIDYSIIDIVEP